MEQLDVFMLIIWKLFCGPFHAFGTSLPIFFVNFSITTLCELMKKSKWNRQLFSYDFHGSFSISSELLQKSEISVFLSLPPSGIELRVSYSGKLDSFGYKVLSCIIKP